MSHGPSHLQLYLDILDRLRRQRAKPGWKPQDDRAMLADLDDLYAFLRSHHREHVEKISWRCWPDKFAEQGRDGMVAYLTTSSRWKMEPGLTGPAWHHIGNPIVMFYDELGDDAGKRVMEVES